MTNICILGDSHTVCIKNAWNSLEPEYPDINLTFFADRGGGLSELEVKDGTLVPGTERLRNILPHTSGGLEAIDPTAYDAVLLVGLVCVYPRTDGYFSQAAIRQELRDSVPKSAAVDVSQKIRQISQIPIFVAHRPLMRYEGEPQEHADVGPYRRIIDFLSEETFGKVGATLLEQPEQTITNYWYTRPEYSHGAVRLDIGDGVAGQAHKAHDRMHMNAQYGAVFLSTHFPAIAARCIGTDSRSITYGFVSPRRDAVEND